MRNSFRLILVIISSILLILSYPDFNFKFLAWVAFIPLFFAIDNCPSGMAFKLSYCAGLLFFLGTIYWLWHVTLLGVSLLILYIALYFAFFGLLANRIFTIKNRNAGYETLFILPAAWVALELIRSYLFTGFGWVLLGHSQAFNLRAIQIADITGAYGVSFIVMMVNVALFILIRSIRKKEIDFTPLAIAIFITFLVITYGQYRLNNIFTGERMRVAIVQGNVSQDKKWDPSFKEEILKRYESLTKAVSSEKCDLIIWPETSVPAVLPAEKTVLERIKSLVLSVKTPLLIGNIREDEELRYVYYNSATLFLDDGRIQATYDKVHLVPFGEYIPMKFLLSFVEKIAPAPIGDVMKGREYTVFSFFVERVTKAKDASWKFMKKVKFSALVCFEDIFPSISRRFVQDGALFLVNITNDAWYKKTSAAYQHAQNSVFRAVENRVNVVRATNTGYSCFIDQKGAILADVSDDSGERLFISGFKSFDIVLTKTNTFYTQYGDIFAYLCLIASILYFAVFRRKEAF